jgi:hypothetical protein
MGLDRDPVIFLGREKHVGLSDLAKDTEKQNAAQPRFDPRTSCSELCYYYATALLRQAIH